MEEAHTTRTMVEGTMAMTTILVSSHLCVHLLCVGGISLLPIHGLSSLALPSNDPVCSPPSVNPASSDKQGLATEGLQACQD